MLIGTIAFVLVLLLVILGVPIAAAVGVCGFVGLLILNGWAPAAGMIGLMAYSSTASYSLSVLPMFLLLGEFAYYGGFTQSFFKIAHHIFGRFRAGLPVATVAACTAMAATSGSTLATATLMGKIAVPEMRKYGYSKGLATGLVAAAGTLSTMIPPSVSLVVYAILTEQPVGKMLLAGYIPGLFTAALYTIYLIFWCRAREKPQLTQEVFNWRVLSKERYALGVPVIVIVIMGSIYFGIATPTEAAAMGALAALLLCFIARQMNLSRAQHAAVEAVLSTSMIFIIIFASLVFARFLAYAGFPEGVTKWVVSLQVSRTVILLGVMLLYLLLGCFIDALGMMILTLPAVFPVMVALGYNPIWFGVIVVQMTEVGLITPPLGITVFGVASVVPDASVAEVFKGAAPFVVVQMANVALLCIFPQIVMFLPNAAG